MLVITSKGVEIHFSRKILFAISIDWADEDFIFIYLAWRNSAKVLGFWFAILGFSVGIFYKK